MTNTRTAIKNWVESMLGGRKTGPMDANSCHSEGEYFVSYSTPIARFVDGKFEVATRKYSCTTSKQQTYLRFAIPTDLLVEVPEIDGKGLFPWRR